MAIDYQYDGVDLAVPFAHRGESPSSAILCINDMGKAGNNPALVLIQQRFMGVREPPSEIIAPDCWHGGGAR